MAGGELAATFRALAEDAAQAGENIGKAMGRFFDDTAEREDASVATHMAAEEANTRAANAIRPEAENLGSSGGGGSDRIARMLRGENPDGHEYQYNMVENPGPVAEMADNPAANFAGGKYDEITLEEDTILYRGGNSEGSGLGQWFTAEPPESVAHVRIDTAVKPEWIDPRTGVRTGTSPIDTVYKVKIPAGTKVYAGPTGYQGGVYVGGKPQIFIPKPWENQGPGGVEVMGSEPLK